MKLEAFEGFLTDAYARHGFVETHRYEWDDQYAPDGWDKETQGTPAVVAMELKEELRNEITTQQNTILNQSQLRQSDGGVQQGDRGTSSLEGQAQAISTKQEFGDITMSEFLDDNPKPSWDDAEDWANWLACDPEGLWYWYKDKPHIDEELHSWMVEDDVWWEMHFPQDHPQHCHEWRDTLERRPSAITL